MNRLNTAGLLRLAGQLANSDRDLLETVGRLRLMSQKQLASLLSLDDGHLSSPASMARQARRVLQRLAEVGLLARLDRQVGGVRAGSNGYVYYLGPTGQRVLAYWHGHGLSRGRYRPDPGLRYVQHRLAVSQLYVDLKLAGKRGGLELLAFDVEPDCWRTHDVGFGENVIVKPDAFVRVGNGVYEDSYFVEVDLGSESRPVIARKLRIYTAYYRSGQEQDAHAVFPRVVLLVNSEQRKAAMVEVCSRLPAEDWQLFSIGLLSDSLRLLGGVQTPGRYGDR